MSGFVLRSLAACGAAVFVCHPAATQSRPDRATVGVRTELPPEIDGVLSDSAWEDAEVLTDFIDIRFDRQAEEQTFVRILYDDEYIYVGAEMIQDASTIQATVYKYDRIDLRFEDYIQVSFDTFFNRKGAYMFLVSPLGTRWDAQQNVYERSQSWDADWDAKAVIAPNRWTVEMRIPIGVMHHLRADDITWGLHIRRSSRRADVFSHWNYDPASGISTGAMGPSFLRDFGLWTGLDMANSVIQRTPEFEAYVSGTAARESNTELMTRDTDLQWSTGLDMKLRLNNTLVSQFTINPDFGQVEADADTIELRDTERFLPERRTFFQEGAELFETPLFLYNSRRISDIKGGVKLTGGGRDWNMGLLALKGEGVRSGDANMLVTRPTYQLTDELQVGAMVQAIRRDNGFNFVLAGDTRYEITPSVVWSTQYAQMFDDNDQALTENGNQFTQRLSEYGFLTEIDGGQEPFFWEVAVRGISDDFDPDLGFIPRTDIYGPESMLSYNRDFETGVVEAYSLFFESQYYVDSNGDQTFFDFTGSGRVEFDFDWDVRPQHSYQFRDPFYDHISLVEFEYLRENRLKSWEIELSKGTFQDVPFRQIGLEKPFGIGDRFTAELTGSYRTEDPDGMDSEDIYLIRLVNEYTFKNDVRVRLTLEESSEKRYNRTLLVAYEDVGDWDFYFLVTDIRSDVDIVRGAFAKFVYRF